MRKFKSVLMLVIVTLLIVALTGCDSTPVATAASTPDMSKQMVDSSKKVAANQSSLEQKIPVPQMDWSNNRANIAKKLSTFGSDPNKVSWIYCFLPGGQCALFTSVKGCVTNLSAYAVPDDQIIEDPYFKDGGYGEGKWGAMGGIVVQAPDADGTYGTNGEGIFWFDTAGVYHEWNGYYMLVDQPVKLSIQPLVTMNIEE